MLVIKEMEKSIQLKIEKETSNPSGERMDELFKCEHCRFSKPDGTLANQVYTLMNLHKYIIVQLKTFSFIDSLKKFPRTFLSL